MRSLLLRIVDGTTRSVSGSSQLGGIAFKLQDAVQHQHLAKAIAAKLQVVVPMGSSQSSFAPLVLYLRDLQFSPHPYLPRPTNGISVNIPTFIPLSLLFPRPPLVISYRDPFHALSATPLISCLLVSHRARPYCRKSDGALAWAQHSTARERDKEGMGTRQAPTSLAATS